MSPEPHADRGACPLNAGETGLGSEPLDPGRPNVSGDLPTVFQAAPMFRRAVAGYDRFQVDTYVRWAEEELATADREREHLVARHLSTRAALEEARQLLSHSSGGGEFLRLSRRIGSMLAAAADEAESMRVEAEADRSAASAEAERIVAQAERMLADARAEVERMVADAEVEAERMLAEAATAVEEMTAVAGRLIAQAELAGSEARAEAEARLEKVRVTEQRAGEHAEQIRRRAAEEASAARVRARDEVIRMLITGREQRRRADAEAAATRERLDRDATTRSAALLAEVETLEDRRSALRAEVELLAGLVAAPPDGRPRIHLRRLFVRLRWRSGFLRAP